MRMNGAGDGGQARISRALPSPLKSVGASRRPDYSCESPPVQSGYVTSSGEYIIVEDAELEAMEIESPTPSRSTDLCRTPRSTRRTELDARSDGPRPHGRSRVTLLVLAVFGASCDRCRCQAGDK